jgi:ATP-dependent DNA helicase RecQ
VTTGADGTSAPPELAARAWALFRELLRYLDARTCRHDFILRYFGDEREVLGGCGHCDICVGLDADAEADGDDRAREGTARTVRMALSAVARARQRAGMVAVAEMLRGVDSEKTRRFGFTELSTFGLLRERAQPWVMDLLRALLAAGWIDLTPSEHPVPLLTPAGAEVMRGQGPVRFALPPERDPRGKKRASDRPAAKASGPGVESLDGPTRERFERLRAHRAQVARARGVPAYVVAFDRTLLDMAMRPPRSHAELLDVYGMGPARVEQYGDGFLEVMREGTRG